MFSFHSPWIHSRNMRLIPKGCIHQTGAQINLDLSKPSTEWSRSRSAVRFPTLVLSRNAAMIQGFSIRRLPWTSPLAEATAIVHNQIRASPIPPISRTRPASSPRAGFYSTTTTWKHSNPDKISILPVRKRQRPSITLEIGVTHPRARMRGSLPAWQTHSRQARLLMISTRSNQCSRHSLYFLFHIDLAGVGL
jgi:hypothetical protein